MKKDINEKKKVNDVVLPAQTILHNIKKFYNELPQSSSIKSSVIQTIFAGVERSNIENILDLSKHRVNKGKLVDLQPLSYYLTELGFTRKKLERKYYLTG